MIHELKTCREYFEAVIQEIKKFEVRENDRNFQIGDILRLQEIDDNFEYTGEEIDVRVLYILDNPLYCKKGYITMTIEII
jgi:hypothetical protein